MASPTPAVIATLKNEDETMRGAITTDPGGGRTRWGIAEKDNPDLWTTDEGPTLEQAIARYTSQYWPIAFSALTSQHIGNFVFDLCINVGTYHGAKIFQRAISACGPTVVIDGVIGGATVQAANLCNEGQLIAAILTQAEDYYQEIVVVHPEDAEYLRGWINRVERDAEAG